MAPANVCGAGVGSDEFVLMLRHLANMAAAGHKSARGRGGANRQPVKDAQPQALSTGRFRLLLARLECAWQSTQDAISSASVLFCLGALRSTLRMVIIHHAAPCSRCSGARGKQGVQVDRLTSIHWTLMNMIVQLRGLRQEKVTRQRAVCEFLGRHKISSALSIRVRRHVDRGPAQAAREADADTLRRLSTELMVDLLEEMRLPALSVHPFFASLRAKHPDLVRELCHEALHPMLTGPEEIVFSAGETCSRMYVVVSGHTQYTFQPRDGAGPPQVRRALHGGQWLSEAALWTGWVHRGELRSVTDCLLFGLDASAFARVISSHESAHRVAAAYARKFVEGLNRGPQTDLVEAGPVDP